MRKFKICAAACVGAMLSMLPFSAVLANETNVLDSDALLITSGDPENPLYANAGANLRNGVGSIFTVFESTAPSGFLCSMTVIDDRHILTAAHCLRNTTPSGEDDPLTRIVVVLPSGVFYLFFSEVGEVPGFAVHPLYDALNPIVGAFSPGDIGVIQMAADLPGDVERYGLYRDPDEFGQQTRHYGHGRWGRGPQGATGGADFFFARTGLNMYEQTLIPFFGSPLFDQLLHDFDSGGSRHNAMEWWFTSEFACAPDVADNPDHAQDGQCTTFKDGSFPDFKGFEKLEVGVAPGDSGGPGFIDGKVAGVHSFGFTHFCEGVTNGTDISCGLNSSYGEMSGDTRVSTYADWVDGVIAGVVPVTPVPGAAPAAAAKGKTKTKDKDEAEQVTVELSLNGKAFMGAVFSRQLRKPISFEEAKQLIGLE
jgi:hypothetical protein